MSFARAEFTDIGQAISSVEDGSSIVITGAMSGSPMSLVRELIRQGKKEIHLVLSPIGGINADMLIGAGAVQSLEFPQISMGEFGLAPNFRRACERGKLRIYEHT